MNIRQEISYNSGLKHEVEIFQCQLGYFSISKLIQKPVPCVASIEQAPTASSPPEIREEKSFSPHSACDSVKLLNGTGVNPDE